MPLFYVHRLNKARPVNGIHDDAGHGKHRIEGPDSKLAEDDQNSFEVLDHPLPSASGLSGVAGVDNASKPAKS
jgi:hypothetical protein